MQLFILHSLLKKLLPRMVGIGIIQLYQMIWPLEYHFFADRLIWNVIFLVFVPPGRKPVFTCLF